ncbi:alcohol dehydrogenase 2 [Trichomonascus vanleenenianus]|uniref:alcohol dehydrogenase ADH1 n=1 Tax=Trichomonascus vanleenenianus TaxID=2268995 RepID=UPI003EC9565B
MAPVYDIPKTQKAVVHENCGPDFKVKVVSDFPVPEVGADEILVRVTSSGVCHSDLSFLDGTWGKKSEVQVAGHEGSGYIVKHGANVNPDKYPLGMRVGVPLVYAPCRDCLACDTVDGEAFCVNSARYGLHKNGSWQQYVPVHSSYVVPVPDGPDEQVVGPVLCGGVTVYKAIKVSGARAGQWVVITGAGGGLGSMAVQFAVAAGCQVIALDTGADKEALTKKLGAKVFIDFAKQDATAEILRVTGGGAHVGIMVAPSGKAYAASLMYMRVRGTIVCVGLPPIVDPAPMHVVMIANKGLRIFGTLVGSKADFTESLDFVKRGIVTPSVTVRPMEEIGDILEEMQKGTLTGRVVIDLK